MKAAKPNAEPRSPDAALGRETRGLVGASRAGSLPRGSGTARRDGASRADGGAGGGWGAPGRGGAGGASPFADGRRTTRLGACGGPRLRRPSLGLPARVVTPARAAGLLGMLAAGFLLSLVTGPTAFGLSRTDLPELAWTSEAAVSDALALRNGSNVVQLDTAPLEAALEALPAVAQADVSVSLPDGIVAVGIVERDPVLAWQAGEARLLVDGSGAIFASVGAETPLPAGVALVQDRREDAADRYVVGARLDAVDLDVATRLGSLTPADVGSGASRLRVVATDVDGFVVSVDGGWTAVFGFYSPAMRSTEMIPAQVRLLRSLLAGREATIGRIILASGTDGTYIPRATPRSSG